MVGLILAFCAMFLDLHHRGVNVVFTVFHYYILRISVGVTEVPHTRGILHANVRQCHDKRNSGRHNKGGTSTHGSYHVLLRAMCRA